MKTIVENFNLGKWVGQEEARLMLVQAGYRGQAPYVTYLFFRMVMPVVMLVVSFFYVFVVINSISRCMIKIGILIGAAYFGHVGSQPVPQEQNPAAAAFDQARVPGCAGSAADLHRIRHVDRGGLPKVSAEIGSRSIALAEELTLTTAELSYLPDRRQAYENLAQRVGLEGVKSVCLALQQAERYGTPLGTTMRVMAQENRDMRMSEAEKKAAGLPPKLTVPMILFFLPVLFVVILGPAAMRVMGLL